MIPFSFVKKYLQETGMCKVSPKKFEQIMTRIKALNPRLTSLSSADLKVILEDEAFGLLDKYKSDNSRRDDVVDVPVLRRAWGEKRAWPLQLFCEERQIMVTAQQIPNDTYPPQFAERVDIKIHINGKLVYDVQIQKNGKPIQEFQTDKTEMSFGYGSLVLAVQSHEDFLGAIVYYGVKKILRNFYGYYFNDEDLEVVSSLEKFEKHK